MERSAVLRASLLTRTLGPSILNWGHNDRCYRSSYYNQQHCFNIEAWMMTSSNGSIFRVTGLLCGEFTGPGEFPTQRPVTRSFDVFFDLDLNKWLSKQPWGWWLETPSSSLWRHCNEWHTFYRRHFETWKNILFWLTIQWNLVQLAIVSTGSGSGIVRQMKDPLPEAKVPDAMWCH